LEIPAAEPVKGEVEDAGHTLYQAVIAIVIERAIDVTLCVILPQT